MHAFPHVYTAGGKKEITWRVNGPEGGVVWDGSPVFQGFVSKSWTHSRKKFCVSSTWNNFHNYPYGRKLWGSRGTKLSDIFHLLLVVLLWMWWQEEIIETRSVRRRRDFPTITTSWCYMSGFLALILQGDLQNTLEIFAGKLKSIILRYT